MLLRSRLVESCVFLAVAGFLALHARAAEIPPELSDAVHHAEVEGLALYEAYQSGPAASDEEVTAARRRLTELCDFSYVPVKVKEGDRDAIYFLAEGPLKSDIVIGRHFRVSGDTVQLSSKSCLSLGTPKPNMAALFVTHLLSPTPTEFHVYLTLQHKVGLFVRTSTGMWLVESGTIKLMDPPKAAPGK
jgi:hypothetical protein